MTPTRKVYKVPTADNYDISDLHSDDSTDDEDQPRKKIPSWATGENIFTKSWAARIELQFEKKTPQTQAHEVWHRYCVQVL